jgi:hypothetical protein
MLSNDEHMENGQMSKYGPENLVSTEVANGRSSCSIRDTEATHNQNEHNEYSVSSRSDSSEQGEKYTTNLKM